VTCAVAVVSKNKNKRPNALKHGVFAATAILPGEKEEEFEELHAALIEEWRSIGATEEDAILSIAKAVWRKRRLQRFLEIKLRYDRVDPDHPSYREWDGLLRLSMHLLLEPETDFDDFADFVRRAKLDDLKQRFPRSKFSSTFEWAEAIRKDINSSLNKGPHLFMDEREQVGALYHMANHFSGELFKQELALDERLDAMIDRAVKRLIQMKAMKQMLGQTS
jgi:hypothetical protein